MKKHSVIQSCAVLAAVAAAGLVYASDAPSGKSGNAEKDLRPAAGTSFLQRVPGISRATSSTRSTTRRPGATSRASGIRKTAHKPSGGGGLLKALGFGSSEEKQPQTAAKPQSSTSAQRNARLQPTPPAAPQQIAQQSATPGQARRNERREQRKQNPGIFRRFFNSIVEVEDEEATAANVPRPPALVYETNETIARSGKSVKAQTVGYQKRPAPQTAQQAPQPHPIRRSTEFINPFVDDADAQGSATLDLDSLVENQDPILTDPDALEPLENIEQELAETVEEAEIAVTEAAESVVMEEVSEAVEIAEEAVTVEAADETPAEEAITAEPLVADQTEEPAAITAEETVATVEEEATESKEEVAETALTKPEEIKTADATEAKKLDAQAKRDQQRYRIMSRTGRAGFKGFCPVALRDDRDLVDSSEEFTAKFGLRTYQFSSAKAKAAFEANPARYAPVAGGSDVVLLVNTEEEISGSLDFSLWYRDRLYLFRSRETQRIFAASPDKYASQY